MRSSRRSRPRHRVSLLYDRARALAANVATEWIGGREMLGSIVHAAGVCTNAWHALELLGADGLARALGPQAGEIVDEQWDVLQAYLNGSTWFDAASPPLEVLRAHPIAYFCAEFGVASWLPIYSGGLGVLAGDVLKSASDLGLPTVGVGLLYRHGYFSQTIDETGRQHESYPTLDPAEMPLEPIMGTGGDPLVVPVPIGERNVYLRAWRLSVGRTALYLLDTDVPENADPADREITAGLYAGDQDLRIRQEIVLGIGGVRALRAMGIEPSIFSMNEGHAAFLGVELVVSGLPDRSLEEAVVRAREQIVYTNHTVVPAGNDVFTNDLVARYLGSYATSSGIGVESLLALGDRGVGEFSMPELAFCLAGKANAVSQIHRGVVEHEWPGHEVEAVTNGVHIATWVGEPMARLLNRYVPEWRSPAADWTRLNSIPAEELWGIRQEQRAALINFVNTAQDRARLDESTLTLVWARRFAEYKRAWLLASDLVRLAKLLGDSDQPVQLVIAGKAHPRDEAGKQVLQELYRRLEYDPRITGRVAFVPNYDIATARVLVAGADVWVNTPRKPLEASGTSGMKSSDNGGLQLTVRDGWAAEVDWWDVGWGIQGEDDESDARELYAYLEEGVVPTFYDRIDGIPTRWLEKMRRSMAISLTRYSARRMVLEYVEKLYQPLIAAQAQDRDAA